MKRSLLILCAVVAGLAPLLLGSAARAQVAGLPPAPLPNDVRAGVARDLFERAVELFRRDQFPAACPLFQETLQVAPDGQNAPEARDFLHRCTKDHGFVPRAAGPTSAPSGGDQPLDPYAASGDSGEPLDPYGEGAGGPGAAPPPGVRDVESSPPPMTLSNRLQLYGYGTGFGLWSGIALSEGTGDGGSHAGVFGLVGAGAGLAGTYLVSRFAPLTEGQTLSLAAGSTWGAAFGLFATHVFDDPTDPNDVSSQAYFRTSFVTGLLGLAAGVGVAHFARPSADHVALTNSFTGYGVVTGLVLGGVMRPAQGRAYSLNALLGMAAGATTGLLLSRKVDVSRKRLWYLDAGVAAGTLPAAIGALAGARNGTLQALSVISLGLMGGGAYLGWRLGEHADPTPDAARANDDLASRSLVLLSPMQGGFQLALTGSF